MSNNSGVNPRIQYLTDDMINVFAGANKLTTYEDINRRVTTEDIHPIDGGIYDKNIFGSCFSKQCNCGRTRLVGRVCKTCGSRVLDENAAWTRYARIDLPVYYCNKLRFDQFVKFMRSNFTINLDLGKSFSELLGDRPLSNTLLWDFCQFKYNEEDNSITATDDITDYSLCSYEGLLSIIIEHFSEKLNQFKSYINSSILVTPIIVRAPRFVYRNGVRELQTHRISSIYKCILFAISDKYYGEVMDSLTTEGNKSMLRATLRRYVTMQVYMLSQLLKPSKQNFARLMQSHQLSNSGRCTIVPSPDLKVDEVYIPRHLMYEACHDEFIEFLQMQNDWSKWKAEYSYQMEALSDQIQSEFDRFIEQSNNGLGKYVVINRNPSLYELNLQACKVKLTNSYTIGLPLLMCAPFGGDFDGDTFSFYVIPDDLTAMVVDQMSPKNLIYYKKNQSHLYTPSHEIMSGLMIATRVIQNPEGLLEFNSIKEANDYRRTNRDFKWQTAFILDGNKTTLAREKLSDLFGTNLNELLNGFNNFITSDVIPELYDKLTEFDDRTKRIQEIQEFALMISTTSGSTAPKLSELHANLDRSYLDRIREIESLEELSEREKDLKIREIYDEFLKDSLSGKDAEGNPRISTELKLKVQDSSRAKISQLMSIVMPQLHVSPDKKSYVNDRALIDGPTPTEYTRHAIENRATQDIKVNSVPNSGYTTRQFVFMGTPYYYSSKEDPKNAGILVPAKQCLGRTLVDGTEVTKEMVNSASKDEMFKVRSVITSSIKDETVITGDCLSKVNKWKEGAHVGISLLSSLTEGLTQQGLSLKHGGNLFMLDKKSSIIAPEDCNLTITDMYVILKGKSGKEYRYAKCDNFVANYSSTGVYKEGECVGVAYHLSTPSYRLDSVIQFVGSNKVTPTKRFLNNYVLVSECYAYEEGVLKFNKVGDKITSVNIGNVEYKYNPKACYFLPEGTLVKEGQRFCTGLLDLNSAIDKVKNYVKVFYLFRMQFNELISGIQPELIEFVYSLIVRLNNGKISRKRVVNAVNENPSVYTRLAFQDSKKLLRSISPKGTDFLADTVTKLLLPSFFNKNLLK